MSDLDPFDDELGAAVRRRAGGGARSTDAAHDAVLRRAGAIRRRRAALGGGGAMAVLLIGGIVLLPRSADEIGPADGGDVLPTFEDVATTIPGESEGRDDASPTVDAANPTTTSGPGTTVRVPAVPDPSNEPSNDASVASTTAPPSISPTSSAAPATSSPTTRANPTTSTPSTIASSSAPGLVLDPFTDTYDSVGGSITVSWTGATFALQAVSPAPGFVADVEDSSATRIRVRFEGPDADSRIEVHIADGQLVVAVD